MVAHMDVSTEKTFLALRQYAEVPLSEQADDLGLALVFSHFSRDKPYLKMDERPSGFLTWIGRTCLSLKPLTHRRDIASICELVTIGEIIRISITYLQSTTKAKHG